MRVLAYLARDYEFAAEATSLLSSVASLAIISKRLSLNRLALNVIYSHNCNKLKKTYMLSAKKV